MRRVNVWCWICSLSKSDVALSAFSSVSEDFIADIFVINCVMFSLLVYYVSRKLVSVNCFAVLVFSVSLVVG